MTRKTASGNTYATDEEVAEYEAKKAAGEAAKAPVQKVDPVAIRVKEIRAKRAKLRRTSTRRDVLAYPSRPGFSRRVVNASHGRIKRFEDNGWVIVSGEETGGETSANDPSKPGSAVTKIVGAGKEGPITGVLMEIPEVIFKEDKHEKQKKISGAERTMKDNLEKDSIQWKNGNIGSELG